MRKKYQKLAQKSITTRKIGEKYKNGQNIIAQLIEKLKKNAEIKKHCQKLRKKNEKRGKIGKQNWENKKKLVKN